MKLDFLIGFTVALSSLTASLSEAQARSNPPLISSTSTAANFSPRPLPRQTKDNLARWGLTEEIWLRSGSNDFATARLSSQTELSSAAQLGLDAVALVLFSSDTLSDYADYASPRKADETLDPLSDSSFADAATRKAERNRVTDATSGATDAVDAAAGVTTDAVDAAAGVTIDAVNANPSRTANLRKAAAFGDPRAQWMLGEELIYSVNQNEIIEGQMMYRLAAEGGVTAAMYGLAFRLSIGFGFEENKVLAATWANRCAELLQVNCMRLMSASMDEGWVGAKKPNDATRWLARAADLGDAEAMVILGNRLQGGFGVAHNPQAAMLQYRRAADEGNTDGMVAIARALSFGVGVEKNLPASAGWYRRAAELEDSEGMIGLGIALICGTGISENRAAGLGWLKRAAEEGNATGMHLFAVFMNGGQNGNKAVAAYWYREAIATGELSDSIKASAMDALVALEGEGVVPKR